MSPVSLLQQAMDNKRNSTHHCQWYHRPVLYSGATAHRFVFGTAADAADYDLILRHGLSAFVSCNVIAVAVIFEWWRECRLGLFAGCGGWSGRRCGRSGGGGGGGRCGHQCEIVLPVNGAEFEFQVKHIGRHYLIQKELKIKQRRKKCPPKRNRPSNLFSFFGVLINNKARAFKRRCSGSHVHCTHHP